MFGAGLFVFAGLLGFVGVLGGLDLFGRAPSWVLGSSAAVVMFALMALALWLFHPKGSDPFHRKSAAEYVAGLEGLGLLKSTEFHAKRAFGVKEFEDEGLHYFLELDDGRVLFLSGQYLYDYEPVQEGPESNQPRTFPCSEFTVRRHRKEGFVVEIRCGGSVLEPELMAPSFGSADCKADRIPGDGQVISGTSYDDLKRMRSGGAAT